MIQAPIMAQGVQTARPPKLNNSLFGWECTKTSIQMLYSIVTLTGMNIGELQRLFAESRMVELMPG